MIESVVSKKVQTNCKKNNGLLTLKMAVRVCDKCNKKEEVRYQTIITSRKRRNGEEKDYCYECAQKGRPMPKGKNDKKWKHGKTYNGYVRIAVNGKRILEHVHVMQEFLGRSMIKGETIHHIDMDKTNNDVSNLYLFTSQSEHQACHISMEKCGFDLLNKFIWFDIDSKQYVLNPISNRFLIILFILMWKNYLKIKWVVQIIFIFIIKMQKQTNVHIICL